MRWLFVIEIVSLVGSLMVSLVLKVTSWRRRYVLTSRATVEILNIVHQSLRKEVASLDDDNWMFEPERDVPF